MKHNNPPGIISILVIVVLYVSLSGCVKTEDAIDPESLMTWEIFDSENGLGSDSVWTLAEDKEGNIWAGTMNNGVSSFDGKMWTIYNTDNGLVDNMVFSIAQDGYGRMWIGTQGGLSILSGNQWINITDFGGVYAILKDYDDNMWISTYYYPVLKYSNDTWYSYYDDECEWCNVVNVLFEDDDRNIWFGSEADLKKFTPYSVTSYTQADGLPTGPIKAMHQDVWGNIWIATYGSKYVARYSNGSFELVGLSTGLSTGFVNSIESDNNGNVWFGLLLQGSVKYNGSMMEQYTVSDGLPGKSVMKILKDRHGYLWFGTLDSGVAKYAPGLN